MDRLAEYVTFLYGQEGLKKEVAKSDSESDHKEDELEDTLNTVEAHPSRSSENWESAERNDESGESSPEPPPYSPLGSPARPQNCDSSPPRPKSRDRSRSPLAPSYSPEPEPFPVNVVIRLYNEHGVPVDSETDNVFLTPDAHPLYVSPVVCDGGGGDHTFNVYAEDCDRDDDHTFNVFVEECDGDDGDHTFNVSPVECEVDAADQTFHVSPVKCDGDGRDDCTKPSKRGRTGGRRGGRGARGPSARGGGYPNRGRSEESQMWMTLRPLREILRNDCDVPPELASSVMDLLRKRKLKKRGNEVVDDSDSEREGDASESENEDLLNVASDGGDALKRLKSENLHFEWSSMETFQGKEENFRVKRTGSVRSFDSPYDAFRTFWDDDILGLIEAQTNLYATKIASPSFQAEWFPTNTHEILCLFSFWMMLGIIRMPTVNSCFSVDPLLKTDIFRRIFTRKRYELLTRALTFVTSSPTVHDSNPANTSDSSADPLHSLRPIITHLNSAFQSNYILSKNICIDESLTLWKGRLKFRQYIRTKHSRFGIKTYELCESSTGYLWSLIVYTGKQSDTNSEKSPELLKSTAIVKKLMAPLLNKGHRLFMDNWYNSPLLARFLKLNGTDCVGTLRSSRRDVPVLVNKAPLKKGEYIARHSGDVTVLAWQDKKRITMISTCHDSYTALPTVPSKKLSRPVPFKPQIVLDYNKYMGGVDLKDQMLEPYLLERKRCKLWHMKLFKRLLNVSILNARILIQSSTKKRYDHLSFRLQLVDTILTKHLSLCQKSRKYNVSSSISMHGQHGIFVNSTHWPVLLEPTVGSQASNRKFWKRCFVCLKEGRSKKTSYCCESCRVPLCILKCFKAYHTK